MKQTWQDYENAPGPLSLTLKAIAALIVIGTVCLGTGWMFTTCNSTMQVAHEEFGARAMLDKYEWFKDSAAQLDARSVNIQTLQARLDALDARYHGRTPDRWSRADQEQANVWSTELAGTIASYNNLAAQYNAAMAKFNWRFANAGELPAGGIPLPREFRPYTK